MYANIWRRSASVRRRHDRDRRPLHVVEAADVVDAEDVVGVRVREEDGVDAADVVRERLGAQIGGRVDEDVAHRSPATVTRPRSAPSPLSRSSPKSSRIDGRVRRSRGSVDRHTAQSQPMAGTPCDVPVPSIVTRNGRGAGVPLTAG